MRKVSDIVAWTPGDSGASPEITRAFDAVYDKYQEQDPNGISAKTPGAKLDGGKVDVTRGCLHYFPRALKAIATLSEIGARKYSWKGWESVPNGIVRYGAALGRHELAIEGDYERVDSDSNVLEATAVAWNACARLELILRKTGRTA